MRGKLEFILLPSYMLLWCTGKPVMCFQTFGNWVAIKTCYTSWTDVAYDFCFTTMRKLSHKRMDWLGQRGKSQFQTITSPLLLLMPSQFFSLLWFFVLCLDFLHLHHRMNEQLNNNLNTSLSVLCRVTNAFWNM